MDILDCEQARGKQTMRHPQILLLAQASRVARSHRTPLFFTAVLIIACIVVVVPMAMAHADWSIFAWALHRDRHRTHSQQQEISHMNSKIQVLRLRSKQDMAAAQLLLWEHRGLAVEGSNRTAQG